MCGIVGELNTNGKPVSLGLMKKMTDSIAYRGPDGQGHFVDGAVGLGHRRLAILDLSRAGHQPMLNEDGTLVLVYNGEIFNFLELKKELTDLGYEFRSKSDTEVLLYAYEEWGDACVGRLNGMFAFAIWDQMKRRLFLARDRFGVKPLYWYLTNETFLFASEIKAILKHPDVERRVCHEALDEYFTFQNIFSDRTLFDGVRLLPPGHTLTLEAKAKAQPKLKRYWDYPSERTTMSEKECEEKLHHLFVQSVKRQLISDVPLGAYLSGGLDSGSIVAVARQDLGRLSTFTGGFDLSSASGLELGFDERSNSEFLANTLKTEHYEMVMHAGDMEHIMPELIFHLEDLRVGQCYPNYYIARLAGKFVKVVLSGTGGDELFGGYPWRYQGGLKSKDKNEFFKKTYNYWQRLVPDQDKSKLFSAETQKAVNDHSAYDVFTGVFSPWTGGYKTDDDFIQASLYFELKTFLHGLLVVEDKLSMAHSLEARVPFLDNDLADFAMSIPPSYKIRNFASNVNIDENISAKRHLYQMKTSDGKAILRQAMSRLIPREVIERSKQGFSAPDASWFRGESIDYINNLLRDKKAAIYSYLNPAYVANQLDEHTSGRANHRLFIWSLLSFEWWLRQFKVA